MFQDVGCPQNTGSNRICRTVAPCGSDTDSRAADFDSV